MMGRAIPIVLHGGGGEGGRRVQQDRLLHQRRFRLATRLVLLGQFHQIR